MLSVPVLQTVSTMHVQYFAEYGAFTLLCGCSKTRLHRCTTPHVVHYRAAIDVAAVLVGGGKGEGGN